MQTLRNCSSLCVGNKRGKLLLLRSLCFALAFGKSHRRKRIFSCVTVIQVTVSWWWPRASGDLRLILFLFFIYLFLTALGLRCCARAFSSCGEQGLCSSCGGRTSLVAERKLQGTQASEVVAHGLRCPVACGIFQARDQTSVPCIARQIFNH